MLCINGSRHSNAMASFEESFRNFLETKTLYSWVDLSPPEDLSRFRSVRQIEMQCEECRRSRPFSDRRAGGMGSGRTPEKTKAEIYIFRFTCDGCSNSRYSFFVEVSKDLSRIRKVGQAPAWSIALDKRLSEYLGEDADTLKKGMICESQGYGIAAFAYYRRVIENVIGSIMTSLHCSLKAAGASKDQLSRLEEAMRGTVMIDQINIAKDCVPSYLRPRDMNPLAIIYDKLSAGIHRLSDDSCLRAANSIRIALVYLVKTLAEQNEEQKEYVDALIALQQNPT
jgi:hypothetical protein